MQFPRTGSIHPSLVIALFQFGRDLSGSSAYIEEYLADDSDFDKLLYEYLIKSGSVTGTQICAIVYEQVYCRWKRILITGLLSGSVDSYSWLYDKIKTLKITPGQLGLEPGSGGLVVTDPNTGTCLHACLIRDMTTTVLRIRWIHPITIS